MPAGSFEPPTAARVTARQWYALLILTVIYACHSLDRAVVSVVIEPLKHELGLSDSRIGVITGLGYGLIYGLSALPLGYLVDRVNRVRLLTILVVVWSGTTALAGFARGFWDLLLARMGVGAAEAGGQPTALSLLADYFPESRRSTALGIFYLGTSVGYAASFLIGGLVASAYGWRAAFFVAGVPGLILGVMLYLTVGEPVRTSDTGAARDDAPPLLAAFRFLSRMPAIRHLFAAMLLASFSVSVMLMWMVPLLMREHGLTLAQAGTVGAITMGVSQSLGAIVAGVLADRIARRGRHRRVLIPAIAMTCSVPLAIGGALSPQAVVAVGCLLGFGLFTSAWTAAGYTTMIGEVESRMRGTMLGAMQVGATLLGSALSPFITGVLSDTIGGRHSLAVAIAILSLTGLWAALHFLLAGRAIARGPLPGA
ncbi:putative MFS family arabinose efflux permease [Novosphingobium hassiacum]|uniref:Putative MFS family arabinose efflux permease n=2 Tax=Novosphingobium hassiacum TaxID=173676 RepID=A0A7W6EWG0_9SPHN|nr:putative MFS family arabinose efflux permease [Novosphingobium hassiacum]